MSEAEAYALLEKCCAEIKRRFLANLPKFRVRCINKDGIKDMKHIVAVGEPH